MAESSGGGVLGMRGLIGIIITMSVLYWYGGVLDGWLKSENGNWWFLFAMTWPLVLAYYVGDDEDRADFHKIRDWLLSFFRAR